MKIIHSDRFKKSFKNFSPVVQKKFEKQVEKLIYDINYPSLHAKKYDESCDIWQARVDRNVRFYFLIDCDTYILLDIKNHPK